MKSIQKSNEARDSESAEPQPLSERIALIRAMGNAAQVYLAMLCLDGPSGAREIAAILGIHEQTAARYLRRLEALSLVKRCRRKQGYVLLDFARLAFCVGDSLAHTNPAVRETAQISQNPPDTALLIQDPSGIQGICAEDPIANNVLSARETVQISQYPQDSAHFSQHLVRAGGGFRADSNAGILTHTPNTTKFSQYQQDTTKLSQYSVNNITNTTTITTDIKLIKLKDSVEVVVLLIAPTTKISQYRKKRAHFGDKYALHPSTSSPWALASTRMPRCSCQINSPPAVPGNRQMRRLSSTPTGLRTGEASDLPGQSAPRSLWSRQPPLDLNLNCHLADCLCLDRSGYWISRAWEDP